MAASTSLFLFWLVVPDFHLEDFLSLEKLVTMDFSINFMFPLPTGWRRDSSWYPLFEDLGPSLCSALEGHTPGEAESPFLAAASPVVTQPPPGGSCQVLLLGSPNLSSNPPAVVPPRVPSVVSGRWLLHRIHLWVVRLLSTLSAA